MNIKAKVSATYRWRLGAITVMFLGWGLWSLNDGVIRYPVQREKALQFQKFTQAKNQAAWPAYAKAHGWSDDDPGPPHTQWDINTQYIMAAICLPIGLAFGVGLILSLVRWIGADDQTLHTSWGVHVPLDQFTRLNKERWRSKGIAVAHYQANGIEQRLVLDDWKYNRKPVTALVALVEERLTPEQIVEPAQHVTASNDKDGAGA